MGTIFFVVVAIVGTFEKYVTNLRATFVENVKKVKNHPTLVNITVIILVFCYKIMFSGLDNVTGMPEEPA
jgi:hypothetical protein